MLHFADKGSAEYLLQQSVPLVVRVRFQPATSKRRGTKETTTTTNRALPPYVSIVRIAQHTSHAKPPSLALRDNNEHRSTDRTAS